MICLVYDLSGMYFAPSTSRELEVRWIRKKSGAAGLIRGSRRTDKTNTQYGGAKCIHAEDTRHGSALLDHFCRTPKHLISRELSWSQTEAGKRPRKLVLVTELRWAMMDRTLQEDRAILAIWVTSELPAHGWTGQASIADPYLGVLLSSWFRFEAFAFGIRPCHKNLVAWRAI